MGIDKILDDISDQISEKNEYLSEPDQKKSSSTGDWDESGQDDDTE